MKISAVALAVLFFACAVSSSVAAQENGGLLRAQGDKIVDGTGRTVTLRGVNLGNWLTLEMWLFGIEGIPDQKTFFDILKDRFGAEETAKLLDLHRSTWITEKDFAVIQSCGMNVARLPIHYSVIEDNGKPLEAGYAWIDKALEWGSKHGTRVILDLHGAPGGQSTDQPCGEVGSNRLWTDPENQKRTIEIWRRLAQRYKNDPRVAAFDLLNEPFSDGGNFSVEAAMVSLCDRILTAIRAEGDQHLVFVAGTIRGSLFYPASFWKKWSNVGLTEHFYPALFSRDRSLDGHAQFLSYDLPARVRLLRKINVPFLVGEYNVVLSATGGDAVMRTYVEIFDAAKWAHTMWCYKAISKEGGISKDNWSLVANTAPLAPPDPRQASLDDMRKFFTAIGAADWSLDESLRNVYTAKDFPKLALTKYPEPVGEVPAGSANAVDAWHGLNVGDSTPAGGVVLPAKAGAGPVVVYGGGFDINREDDAFYFLQQPASGDFAFEVEIGGFAASEKYAKAGLMIRASNDSNAPLAYLHIFPNGELTLAVRNTARAPVEQKSLGSIQLPARLRLERQGGRLRCSVAESANAMKIVSDEPAPALPDAVQAGYALLSHDPYHLAATPIRNLQMISAKP
ncbi:MAG: cellulase family glycosylhydrolase [Chthoniobacterales bacterium]